MKIHLVNLRFQAFSIINFNLTVFIHVIYIMFYFIVSKLSCTAAVRGETFQNYPVFSPLIHPLRMSPYIYLITWICHDCISYGSI